MKLLPLVSKHTVILRPRRTKVKTLPYCYLVSLRQLPQDVLATHLLLVGEEELVRVDAVRNGATNDGEQVEDDWRLIGVLEQQLGQNIEYDGEGEKGGKAGGDKRWEGGLGGESPQWPGDVSEDTHSELVKEGRMQMRGRNVVGGASR
jgi:hypothetical protein